MYWVTGGTYTGTDFQTIADGNEVQRYGPFIKYSEAEDMWRLQSMQHIDECYTRFEIGEE